MIPQESTSSRPTGPLMRRRTLPATYFTRGEWVDDQPIAQPFELTLGSPVFRGRHPSTVHPVAGFGVVYTVHKRPYPHDCCRKMRGMQYEEAILSRRRFLELCVVGIAGLSLLSLVGCGGSQGGGGNRNKKKHNKGGGGGGY